LELPLERLGLPVDRPYRLTDVLSDSTYTWQGVRNYVQLDPYQCPAHLFRIDG
jgi:starch synthase (maltosyl-transferring)